MIDITAFCLDDLLIQLTCAVALGFVVAQPLLRLRHPRPPAQLLIRQSGFAACVITMWAVLVVFAIGGSAWYSHVVLSTALVRGVAVFLLWVVLGLPPWRNELDSTSPEETAKILRVPAGSEAGRSSHSDGFQHSRAMVICRPGFIELRSMRLKPGSAGSRNCGGRRLIRFGGSWTWRNAPGSSGSSSTAAS